MSWDRSNTFKLCTPMVVELGFFHASFFASKGSILYYPHRNSQSSSGKPATYPFIQYDLPFFLPYYKDGRLFNSSAIGCDSSGCHPFIIVGGGGGGGGGMMPKLHPWRCTARIPPKVISDEQISKPGPENSLGNWWPSQKDSQWWVAKSVYPGKTDV